MKKTYKKSQPKIITYRSHKHFNNDSFREALLQKNAMPKAAMKILKTLPLHAILFWIKKSFRQKKHVRGNQSPFMNKTLPKRIMQRSKPRNIFLKNRTEENRNNYAKQRNLCVTLLRTNKIEFHGNFNGKKLCDTKKFCGVVKPVLSNKVVSHEKITLVEQGNIVENDKKLQLFSPIFSLTS